MNDQLTTRHRDVLGILVADYIASSLPIGSRTIAKRMALHLSPATIRHVMADLTDMGLLTQPHTSAGRVPTVNGLRYYVESLLEVHELSPDEQDHVREHCHATSNGLQGFMRQTSTILSAMSRYVGLVVMPGGEDIFFKHIEFIRLTRQKLLGIFVAQSGMVHNQLITVDEEWSTIDLEKINHFCNRAFMGLNLSDAREKIARELEHAQRDYDRLLKHALYYTDRLLAAVPADAVMMEGETQLQELRCVLEEKQRIMTILDRCREGEGVKIFIGAESDGTSTLPASVVTAPYRRHGRTVGVLGVVGPQCMNYSQVVPVVDFTAKLVSDFLDHEVAG